MLSVAECDLCCGSQRPDSSKAPKWLVRQTEHPKRIRLQEAFVDHHEALLVPSQLAEEGSLKLAVEDRVNHWVYAAVT